jgi:hypothetical protein
MPHEPQTDMPFNETELEALRLFLAGRRARLIRRELGVDAFRLHAAYIALPKPAFDDVRTALASLGDGTTECTDTGGSAHA